MTSALLPNNSTQWERAMADAMAVTEVVGSGITAMRRVKYVSPRPTMLPFLVWEYGLGELSPYVPNLYDLIDQGVRWQRLRGTVSAVAIGLAWIGYAGDVEEAWTGRRWWNSFQLRFPTLPVADSPDLERIEGITSLSVPKRSQLRRGVHHYDVGPLEADHSVLDGAMLDTESGIAVTAAGTIWSFGREHETAHALTKAECEAAGFWIEPNWAEPLDLPSLWVDLNMLWVDANFPWATTSAEEAREQTMAAVITSQAVFLRLQDADGAVIGYRRCRAVSIVAGSTAGHYRFAGEDFTPQPVGRQIYVEALTQFDDADGVDCTAVNLIVGASLATGVKPGKLWLEPGQLVGGHGLAHAAIDVPLRRTVRDCFKFLLTFEPPPMPLALAAIGDDPNALAFDFTDNSFASRRTSLAELLLGDAVGMAFDFRDDSYAERA